MTHQELKSAWISVSLAIENLLVDNKSLETRYVRHLAVNFGAKISNPEHIEKVLNCIEFKLLTGMIDR